MYEYVFNDVLNEVMFLKACLPKAGISGLPEMEMNSNYSGMPY